MVEKGKAEEIARNIFEKYGNSLGVTIQGNAISNIGVQVYFNGSEQIYRMVEEMKGTRFCK